MVNDAIKKNFSFLCSEFGGSLVKEEEDSYGTYLTYITDKAGLRISFEPYEGGFYIMIFPLIDKTIPEYNRWFDIIDLFFAHGIEFEEKEITNLAEPDLDEINLALNHFSFYAKSYAKEFLAGDFGLINKLNEIVEKRGNEQQS